MSAKRPSSEPGRAAAGDLPTRIGTAHDPSEPLPPGTQRHLSPAARQQPSASDDGGQGGGRQPGGHDTAREQYGQHGSGAGQPSQFGGVPSQQHAGHGPRSGGTQDPRHAEEDDYAAPWGVYGGEYGQFDRSPGRQQAFGQQDLGFGSAAGGAGRNPRWAGETGGHGPGASQPWRGEGGPRGAGSAGEGSEPGASGFNPYGPGQYGASAEGGPQRGGDPGWGDHDSQGSQDWQGYSGGPGWQPGPGGGWGGSPGHSGDQGRQRAGSRGGPDRESAYGTAGQGTYGGPGQGVYGGPGQGVYGGYGDPGDPYRAEPWRSGQGRRYGQQADEPRASQPSARGGWRGADAGPPVRDPSHDWGTSDAQPWASRHRADDDHAWSGGSGGGQQRSFDNPYGRREGSGGASSSPQLGEHQGSPHAGGRRGGIGSLAAGGAAAQRGWNPSEHQGGRYGAQGFGASGHGGTGWSTPPGAGQPDNRPWDEQRSRHAGPGPAGWRGEPQGSGWRSEPGSGADSAPDVDEPPGSAGGRGDWRGARGTPGRHDAGDEDHHHHHHDPDYHQWRAEQLKNFDDDYRQWRQERYRRFSDEFNEWRQRRSRGGPASPGSSAMQQSSGSPGGPDTTPGGAQASTGGLRPEPASASGSMSGQAGGRDAGRTGPAGGASGTGEAGQGQRGQPGSAHDVGVSGSTHAGSKPDEQGAAQGRTLPSAAGESRDTSGTSGGPGQTRSRSSGSLRSFRDTSGTSGGPGQATPNTATTRDTGKPGKGKQG
ncbi:MAG: hypothetical protein HZB72_08190 [Burkholderiales bacterium]|nr:hypothetical protein [Burkholderiales bacterium]